MKVKSESEVSLLSIGDFPGKSTGVGVPFPLIDRLPSLPFPQPFTNFFLSWILSPSAWSSLSGSLEILSPGLKVLTIPTECSNSLLSDCDHFLVDKSHQVFKMKVLERDSLCSGRGNHHVEILSHISSYQKPTLQQEKVLAGPFPTEGRAPPFTLLSCLQSENILTAGEKDGEGHTAEMQVHQQAHLMIRLSSHTSYTVSAAAKWNIVNSHLQIVYLWIHLLLKMYL